MIDFDCGSWAMNLSISRAHGMRSQWRFNAANMLSALERSMRPHNRLWACSWDEELIAQGSGSFSKPRSHAATTHQGR